MSEVGSQIHVGRIPLIEAGRAVRSLFCNRWRNSMANLAKAQFAINPIPLAEANGNEADRFIAVPFMGRIIATE